MVEVDISGDLIVYVAHRRFVTVVGPPSFTVALPDLFLYDRATRTERLIAQGPNGLGAGWISNPTISGNLVAWERYTAPKSSRGEVVLMDLTGGPEIVISTTGTPVSMSGDRLAFLDSRSGSSDLYVVQYPSLTETQVTSSGDVRYADIDGTTIVFHENSNGNVHWVDLADPGLIQHTIINPIYHFRQPSVSGHLVLAPCLFDGGPGGNAEAVCTVDLNNEEVRELFRTDNTFQLPLHPELSQLTGVFIVNDHDTGEDLLYGTNVLSGGVPTLIGSAVDVAIDRGGDVVFANGGDVYYVNFSRAGWEPSSFAAAPPSPTNE